MALRRLPDLCGLMDQQGDLRARAQDILSIQLLGGFRITRGSSVIAEDAWSLRNAGHIVKLLALAPGYTLHREEIMDHLWPDRPPDAAANNLRYNLHVARRILRPIVSTPDEILKLTGQQVQLAPAGWVRTDISAFEQAVAAAGASDSPAQWEATLAHYAGDLLPGDRYEDWAVTRREFLREMFLQGMTTYAVRQEAAGDVQAAAATLKQVVTLDGAREGAHVQLMRLYALRGQRGLALRQYGRLRDALRRDLDVDPEPISQQLYQAILTGLSPADAGANASSVEAKTEPATPGRHNLPAPQDSFIGRQREIQEVAGLLDAARFLTLIGSGGVGKTRLAMEIARGQARQSADDIWLVNLATLTDAETVAGTLAATLGIHETPGADVTARLVNALRSESMLLILDNCEHLVDAVAALTTALLGACPGVRILATSRAPTRVPGEVTYRVPSLTLPGSGRLNVDDESSQAESVQLFVHRANQRQRDFRLTSANVAPVAAICRKLDGIPLALELAAARTSTLSVEQIAARIDDSLHLLTNGNRVVAPRHQTLRAALDWSYKLLDEPERRLFDRLSVFAGGWTLEAAEAVGLNAEVLDLLASLADKSLVTLEASDLGLRYRMLAPVRQYAAERLREQGQEYVARQRHAEHMRAFVTAGEMHLRGQSQAVWIGRYELEHDNLRAALAWSLEAEPRLALRLAADLGRFWYIRGYGIEGRSMLGAALSAAPDGDPATRGKALYQAGILADEAGDHGEAEQLLESALSIFRESADTARVGAVLNSLGAVTRALGNLTRAQGLFEDSLEIRRESGDPIAINIALNNLATVAWSRGDLNRAETLLNETLAFDRATGDDWSVAISTAYLGRIAWERRQHPHARDLFHESSLLGLKAGDQGAVAEGLEGLAGALGLLGEPNVAAQLWGAAEALRDRLNVPIPSPERPVHDRMVTATRALTDPMTFTGSWSTGRLLDIEAALSLAESAVQRSRAQVATAPDTSGPLQELTAREAEIVTLITQEHTNQQIAATLGIAPRTVDTHVSRILRKFGVSSRTEVSAKMGNG